MSTTIDFVTDDVVETFSRDGVVLLRRVIDSGWIDELRLGVDRNLDAPTERGRLWHADADGHRCLYDSQAWQTIEEYQRFIEESPMAEIAGRVMATERVNFYFDAVFVRSPGTQFQTPFHQDEPYWSVDGFDTCSAWIPLDPVDATSALAFVRGSHRWTERFAQTNFGALTGDERDQVTYDPGAAPFPDIDNHRGEYDVVSWDMEPGDIVLFNARTAHGGSGQLPPGRGLRVFNTKWLGDDVRVIFRPEGMDPDHSAVMTEVGLRPGDPLGTHLYPELWRRPS